MAYDATFPIQPVAVTREARRVEFRRAERLVLLMGAGAFGAVAGFGAAIMAGRYELWLMLLAAAPFMVLALHLTSQTLVEAIQNGAIGCAIATGLHATALLTWPMTSLLIPLSASIYWIAPLLAGTSLILFASCWTGPARAVYRTAALGALVAAVTAHQGAMLVLAA